MIMMMRARNLLWMMLLAAITVALCSAALMFRRSRAAPSSPTPSQVAEKSGTTRGAGVVCFGVVDLEHGVISLAPVQPGRITEVLVHENQSVSEGVEMLRLDDRQARSRLAEADAAVQAAASQVEQARKTPEQNRKRVIEQEATLDVMRSRLAAAKHALAREQDFAKQKVVANVDVTAAQEKVREVEAMERIEIQRLAEVQAEDVESSLKRAEAELAAATARRDQARLALEEYRLKAPKSGTVLRILVGPGEILTAQSAQPAILFAADEPQVIRATVEQEFAPRVKEGQPALVQDEADSSLTWRGRVERVAGWYSQRRTVLHDPSQMSDVRTLECVVILEPDQPRLRLGQSVRVYLGAARP
jgi:multidrug resistance efflux pump